jgi:hypothetical protein
MAAGERKSPQLGAQRDPTGGMLLTVEGNQHGGFEASKKEETASELSSQAGDKLRVLVVEDDPADVELVLRALR